MLHLRYSILTIGLISLWLPPVLADGQKAKLTVPLMPGMRATKKVPLSEALEKSSLCAAAKIGPELAISMAEEADYKVYKVPKSVREVVDFYLEAAAKNGMPDATPTVWDNSKGKEDEKAPKDSSGQVIFALNLENERLSVTVVAYRTQKDSATTVYVFQTQGKK